MPWMQIIVDEVLKMEILKDWDQFYAKLKRSLESKFALTFSQKFWETCLKSLKSQEIIIFFLATPVHIGNANAALHGLVNLTFLQKVQWALLRLGLDFFTLEHKHLIGLRMRSVIKQRFMFTFQPRTKSKSTYKSNFNGFH